MADATQSTPSSAPELTSEALTRLMPLAYFAAWALPLGCFLMVAVKLGTGLSGGLFLLKLLPTLLVFKWLKGYQRKFAEHPVITEALAVAKLQLLTAVGLEVGALILGVLLVLAGVEVKLLLGLTGLIMLITHIALAVRGTKKLAALR